jgi:uncharacterized protein (DUF1684 family)
LTDKVVKASVQAEKERSLSKRARAAGDLERAGEHSQQGNWHSQAAVSIQDHGNRQARSVPVANGEALPSAAGWLKDTLADPDVVAIDSSRMRGEMLEANDVTALAIDVSKTAQADNTVEKLLAHQMALAHKIAFEQATRADRERDPYIAMKRLQISARMMDVAQSAAVTLQKLKAGGPQAVVVQHVHVGSGGQAVVGTIQSTKRGVPT